MVRRDFIRRTSALVGGSALTAMASAKNPAPGVASRIALEPGAGSLERLAANELARGLANLGPPDKRPSGGDLKFVLSVRGNAFKHSEAYEIRRDNQTVHLTAAGAPALLYAVVDFLERQGAFFGLDGEVYPLEARRPLELPPANQPWTAQPSFNTRGLLPFPDFLNCISVYNREEYRAALEAMARMRLNTLFAFCHSSGNEPQRVWNTESFLSFEYGGVGHWTALQTTSTLFQRWGYLPQRTSQFGMGAPDLFAGEVFGADAAIQARNIWEEQANTQKMLAEAFRYAHKLGIRVVMGFEVYSIPTEIVRATPPEARLASKPDLPLPPLDPESMAAKDILEARLAHLLETYPDVDYISLWQDEATNFATRKGAMRFSFTPFKQAYDFLRRHAPKVRMVVSGWGGVVRHFSEFHKQLPEDVIFSALTDSLGWDPINPEYARLESRERWPIPWLEDDGAMWFPQLHVHRWRKDMDLARQYGCQGMVGIHWRTRIIDPNAGFLSRYSWQESLQPEEFYRSYARALARPPKAEKLAAVLNEADRDRLLLGSLATDEITTDGFNRLRHYSPDYNDGFRGWTFEPPDKIKTSQAKVAKELRLLTESSSSAAEYERLNYLTRQVEFLVPYSASYSAAFRIREVLARAAQLKKAGRPEEAGVLVQERAVPLWMEMAPSVREAILGFQEIASTWNDVGTVASLHNKYERMALFRLPASLKEYMRGLPDTVQEAISKAREPDVEAPARVFIPTRPTVLARGERVRVLAIVQGGRRAGTPILAVRVSGGKTWAQTPMKLLGRRTYAAELSAPGGRTPFLDYYVSVNIETAKGVIRATAPLEAPARSYGVTLLNEDA